MNTSINNLYKHPPLTEFSSLYSEWDIPGAIFSYLPLDDICNVELVCHSWRAVVAEHRIWEKKLHLLYTVNHSWQTMLTQLSWKDIAISHVNCKLLYMKVASMLGPSYISEEFGQLILNDAVQPSDSTTHFNVLEESLFLSEGMLANRQPLVAMASRPHALIFRNDCGFSGLHLIGPRSFPIVTTTGLRVDTTGRLEEREIVIAAGSSYGKGRVVVVSHEALLNENTFMQYLADWCGRRDRCPIAEDMVAEQWTNRGWQPCRVTVQESRESWTRKKLRVNIPVFVTRAHYDTDAEYLLEYVQQGGGLIVGGHAWWWASQNPNMCSLLEHPGNRFLAPMGIVLSSICGENGELNLTMGRCPGLKYSLFYALKCAHDQPNSVGIMELAEWSNTIWGEEYENWIDQLKGAEHFKDLLDFKNVP